MPVSIRRFEPADRDTVIKIWNQVFPDSTGHNAPALSIDRKCNVDDGLFFVAELDGAVVGTAMVGYDGHRGWIYSLAVPPSHQRRGIGKELIRHGEEVLRSLGCPKVNLQVRADNESVVDFYRSLGYAVEQRVSMGKLLE